MSGDEARVVEHNHNPSMMCWYGCPLFVEPPRPAASAAPDSDTLRAALQYLVDVYAYAQDKPMSLGQANAWERARAALSAPTDTGTETTPQDHPPQD